jgi:hypothetical protein
MDSVTWRKSTRSGGNGGDCVEVADLSDAIYLRDSKDPAGPVLRIDRAPWQTFVAGVRGEHFRR